MIDLAALAGRTDVSAVHAAGTAVEDLCIRKVVVCWWTRNNQVRVVSKYVEGAGVGSRDRSRDISWKARVHNADINAIIQDRLSPVAGLIAVGVIGRNRAWTTIGKTDLRDARNEVVLRIESGPTDTHDARRVRERA